MGGVGGWSISSGARGVYVCVSTVLPPQVPLTWMLDHLTLEVEWKASTTFPKLVFIGFHMGFFPFLSDSDVVLDVLSPLIDLEDIVVKGVDKRERGWRGGE